MPFFYELIVILLMIFFNAIFAAYEMALASISRARLAVLISRKKDGAEEAAFMKDRMEASLAVTQVGMTLMGAIAAATGGAGVTESLAPYLEKTWGLTEWLADIVSLIFLIIPLSVMTIIFAELVPKIYAINNRERICLSLSPVMKFLSQMAYPVITVFERVVKGILILSAKSPHFRKRLEDQPSFHELHAAANLARAAKLIGAREEKIVLSAASLSMRPVKQIMLPIEAVSTLALENSLSDALVRAHMDMHTRFPVCAREGDPQTIEGYVNFKDIIAALRLNPEDPSLKGIIRPIKTVRDDTAISHVLEQMMQEKMHIALVGDQEGKTAGMVTLEDIIEELVGEIEDEYDRLTSYIHPYGGGWIMGGGVLMGTIFQTTGIDLGADRESQAHLRLSDWCEKKLGRAAKGGETIEHLGLQVIIRKLRRKKVAEAIVNVVKS